MAYKDRIKLIKNLEQERGSTVICYLTSLRPGIPASMAEDQVRVLFDHLLRLPERPVEKLDVFLCSNGGSGTVPWRLVSLFREFSKSFNVLIPYRAYSAATRLGIQVRTSNQCQPHLVVEKRKKSTRYCMQSSRACR